MRIARVPRRASALDVVVQTGRREGLVRVLSQALLARVPVVSFDYDPENP